MADMTQRGHQTTDPQRAAGRQHTDLDQLTVSEPFSDAHPASLPRHTAASVAKRWDEKSFDTGARIRGEVIGGKR